jgi:hypothetical protein
MPQVVEPDAGDACFLGDAIEFLLIDRRVERPPASGLEQQTPPNRQEGYKTGKSKLAETQRAAFTYHLGIPLWILDILD